MMIVLTTSSLTVGISLNVMNGLFRDMEKTGALTGTSILNLKRKRRKKRRRKKKKNRIGHLTHNWDGNPKMLCPWIYGLFFW